MAVVKMGQLLDVLPLEQRLTRYRQFAEDSLRLAAVTCDPVLRAGHISMASGWHVLAAKVENAMTRFDGMLADYGGQLPLRRRP